jgi:hypothetical protein
MHRPAALGCVVRSGENPSQHLHAHAGGFVGRAPEEVAGARVVALQLTCAHVFTCHTYAYADHQVTMSYAYADHQV